MLQDRMELVELLRELVTYAFESLLIDDCLGGIESSS